MPHPIAVPTSAPAPSALRRLAAATAVGTLTLGAGMLTASPAWAHDTLISSTPEDGAEVTEPLDEVTLEFSGDGLTTGEGITNEIRVTDEDGDDLATETEVDGATMSTTFDEPLPDGEYDVVYRVVYSDGHDEEGELSFAVDAGIEDGADAEGEDAEADEATDDDAADDDAAADEEEAGAEAEADELQDPVSEEGDASGWMVILLGIGGVLIVLLAVIMMRRKVNQVEEWKQGRREPGGSGGPADGRDSGATDPDDPEGPDRTP
ncbi:copper resistance CopC family protein [Nesterenkonia marinintestina]|uniref:copper resistance CopC family protein n=1 Tax=Nesterenkonia marinintestina TaxID=2979865 RepID=UPI0021BFEF76|nr:copper resistance CopC family protein [Nesterenkonia sp. GX14115]